MIVKQVTGKNDLGGVIMERCFEITVVEEHEAQEQE